MSVDRSLPAAPAASRPDGPYLRDRLGEPAGAPLAPAQVLLAVVLLFCALVGTHELMRRLPLAPALALVVGLPLLGVPLWLPKAARYEWTWFISAKLASVAAVAAAMLLGRSLTGSALTALAWVLYGLLALNIVEAVLKELRGGSRVNALAGSLLALSAPFLPEVAVSDTDLRYAMSTSFVLAYTAWNFAFVYAGDNGIYPHHVAVLGSAAVLAAWFGPDLWLQARAFTLLPFVLAYMTGFRWFYLRFSGAPWHSPWLRRALAWLSLIAVLGHLGLQLPTGLSL